MLASWGSLLLSVLLSLQLFAANLEPQRVSKNADIQVPEGMHLIVDRAGERWLLPLGMETPPEKEVKITYFETNESPKLKERIGSHEVLTSPLPALETIVSENIEDNKNLMQRLPKRFAELMYLEKAANLHAKTSNDLRSLGLFAPAEFTTFKLPYIPIPESELSFAKISEYASSETRNLLRFTKDGKKYIRFFIHPNYVKSYAELINKFGIAYHFDAMSSSSPRSLIVMDPDKPGRVHWIKVSLHKKLDGSVRINTDKKAHRAIIMSEAINEVPKEALKSYGLRFLLEPAAFTPKGMISSTIHRELIPELLKPKRNKRWIPAFILQNTGENAVEGLNIRDMAELAKMQPSDFIKESIIRPLLRSYLNMGIIEGLPGELHTQNFYFELQKKRGGWLPTGEVLFKDNDGFRYDTELALRRGRGLNFFAKFDNPFGWGKYSNTIGKGGEKVPFIGSWYYKLIRNVKGFETLAAYMLRALEHLEPNQNWNKDRIQQVFDDIAAREVEKVTDIRLKSEDYGFGANKGLNKVLNEFRAQLSLKVSDEMKNNEALQEYLAKEWQRLKEASRTSAMRRSLSKTAYYVVHIASDNAIVIEARTQKTTKANPDPTIAFAIVEEVGSEKYNQFKNKIESLMDQKQLSESEAQLCRALF